MQIFAKNNLFFHRIFPEKNRSKILGNAVFGIVEELKLIRTFGKTVNIAAFRKQLDKIIHVFRNPAVQSIVNGSQSVFERNIGRFQKADIQRIFLKKPTAQHNSIENLF